MSRAKDKVVFDKFLAKCFGQVTNKHREEAAKILEDYFKALSKKAADE